MNALDPAPGGFRGDAPEAPLTVREAAALAAGESPAVARARAETDVARARQSAARSRLWPLLTAEAGFLSTNDPVDAFSLALKQERFSALDFFASDPNHPGTVHDWSGALAASWSVDLFGSVRGEARAAEGSAQAAERSAGRTRDASAMQAVLAFAAARRAAGRDRAARGARGGRRAGTRRSPLRSRSRG